jgi:CRISPR/Cas system-associated endonuclease/helicase Cas3
MCQDLCSQIQRAGRCARDSNVHGLFLYMPEPWALTQVCNVESQLYEENPDLPFPLDANDWATPQLKSKSTPKDQRISQGSLAYIQTSDCRRRFQANYLGDESPNGLMFQIYLTRLKAC